MTKCPKCGKEKDRDGYYCSECLEKKREYDNQERKYYIEHHVCPRCRREKLYGKETVCIVCSQKDYERKMKSRKGLGREHYNKTQREWAKVRYKKDVENGICTICRKRKAYGGYRTCGICREKQYNRRSIKYQEKAMALRDRKNKLGLCYFCDNPVKEGYKVCENHWKMNVEKSKMQKNKAWKKIIVRTDNESKITGIPNRA